MSHVPNNKQKTLQNTVTFTGTGLHSGTDVTVTLRPAGVDAGICFVRTDVSDRDSHVPALWDRVVDTRLCTVIGNEAGVTVGTIEHLMAALRGCGIDNVTIELDGPEVPIMDGSATVFVDEIHKAGLQSQKSPRRVLRILKEVSVTQNGATVSLMPDKASVFAGEIDFDHPDIGRQRHEICLMNGEFSETLADARTFGFLHEVEALRKMGLALGGSLDNAIVLDPQKILNKEGLRYKDEFIRHKLLDAIGDVYLAGLQIQGLYEGDKAGHAINNALLHELFATAGAWELVTLPETLVKAKKVTSVEAVS